VQQWLALAEEGANEEQSTDVRASVARSMLSSGVCELWAAQAHTSTQMQMPTETIAIGYVRVRVWLLALVLLQDDEDTVRRIAGEFVRRASAAPPVADAESSCTHTADAGYEGGAALPILPPLLAVDDINLSAAGQEIGKALVQLISAADAILNDTDPCVGLQAGASLDTVRASIESILYAIDKAVGNRQMVRDVIVTSELTVSASRVFEIEQANLHLESRATAAVLLSSLVYTVRTCLKPPSNGSKNSGKRSRFPVHVQGWLLTRAWTALDFINASTAVTFTNCCGGATFDKRVFIWCETVLHAVANLWQESAPGEGHLGADGTNFSPDRTDVGQGTATAGGIADGGEEEVNRYGACLGLDIGEALGQSPTAEDLCRAVQMVQEKVGRAGNSRSEVHPLLLRQLRRLLPSPSLGPTGVAGGTVS